MKTLHTLVITSLALVRFYSASESGRNRSITAISWSRADVTIARNFATHRLGPSVKDDGNVLK